MELLHVGSEPVGMRCPFCYEDVMTKAQYKNSRFTHIVALILGIFFWIGSVSALLPLCLFGKMTRTFGYYTWLRLNPKWLCCCIIPYVTKRWKNVEHYCPNCRRYLGLYSRRSMIL